MDRFTEMQVFVRVADENGFSAAARALRLTPSAVSRHVSSLEDRLDVRLINRTTRHLSLTDEGRAFYQRSTRILADVDAAERAAGRSGHAPTGVLRVNATIAFGTYQIARVLPDFLDRYPEVRVELTLSDDVGDLAEEGTDVAIRFGAGTDSSLIARKLGEDRRVICAAPGYLERFGTPRRPEDLRHHACLVRTASMAELNLWRFRGPDGPYKQRVTGRVEVNNTDTLLRMALSGAGIARLAEFLVGPYILDGRLVPVLTEDHVADIEPIHAVYLHRRHVSARIRAFVDYLVETFTPVPPWAHGNSGAAP